MTGQRSFLNIIFPIKKSHFQGLLLKINPLINFELAPFMMSTPVVNDQ